MMPLVHGIGHIVDSHVFLISLVDFEMLALEREAIQEEMETKKRKKEREEPNIAPDPSHKMNGWTFLFFFLFLFTDCFLLIFTALSISDRSSSSLCLSLSLSLSRSLARSLASPPPLCT